MVRALANQLRLGRIHIPLDWVTVVEMDDPVEKEEEDNEELASLYPILGPHSLGLRR